MAFVDPVRAAQALRIEPREHRRRHEGRDQGHDHHPVERAARFLDRNRVLAYLIVAYLVARTIVVLVMAR